MWPKLLHATKTQVLHCRRSTNFMIRCSPTIVGPPLPTKSLKDLAGRPLHFLRLGPGVLALRGFDLQTMKKRN